MATENEEDIESQLGEIKIPVTENYLSIEDEEAWNILRTLGSDELYGIFEFLQAKDLLNLTCTSKWISAASESESIWRKIYEHDFSLGTMDLLSLSFSNPKSQYIKRVEERKKKLETASKNEWMRIVLKNLSNKRNKIQRTMDILHIRLMNPLIGLSILCTLVFVALKLDGHVGWSIWAVLSPIWLLFVVLFIACGSGGMLYHYRSDADSLFHKMFDQLRGVVWFVLERFEMDKRAIAISASATFLVFTFMLLLATKLSFGRGMPWGIVFLPLWITFMITSASPCLRWGNSTDIAGYFFFMLFAWSPLLVFFSLLAAKLSGSHISLALVFIPFWIIDCILMSGTCGVFVFQMVKWYRLGWRDDTSIGLLSFVIISCILFPIFIFEILLCLYENGMPELSALQCFSPFLFCCAILSVILCVTSCRYETPYEHDQRTQSNLNLPGNTSDTESSRITITR